MKSNSLPSNRRSKLVQFGLLYFGQAQNRLVRGGNRPDGADVLSERRCPDYGFCLNLRGRADLEYHAPRTRQYLLEHGGRLPEPVWRFLCSRSKRR